MAAGVEYEGFGELGAVYAVAQGELIGASGAIDDVGNLDGRVVGVGVGLAEITGELERGDG